MFSSSFQGSNDQGGAPKTACVPLESEPNYFKFSEHIIEKSTKRLPIGVLYCRIQQRTWDGYYFIGGGEDFGADMKEYTLADMARAYKFYLSMPIHAPHSFDGWIDIMHELYEDMAKEPDMDCEISGKLRAFKKLKPTLEQIERLMVLI